jgi:hypothetical protein
VLAAVEYRVVDYVEVPIQPARESERKLMSQSTGRV